MNENLGLKMNIIKFQKEMVIIFMLINITKRVNIRSIIEKILKIIMSNLF